MLIKWADDGQRDLEALNALLRRPGLHFDKRRLIEREIRFVRSGIRGEDDAAYQIDAHFRESRRTAVIHGLRLELGDRVAQIDHLLITRVLHIWVCETKSFAEGVEINEQGEWARLWKGEPIGMESPIEQNRLHIAVLRDVLKDGLVPLPKRLGVTLRPVIDSLVLISSKGQIRRPAGARVDGMDRVIKLDQLKTAIDRDIETETTARAIQEAGKLVSSHTLEEFAWRLAALHKPIAVDWVARFGLDKGASEQAPRAPIVRCALCERVVTAGEVDYCQDQRERFSSRIFCYACQHK